MNEVNLKINRLLESHIGPGQFPAIFIRGGAMTISVADRAYISKLPVEFREDGFIPMLEEALHPDFFRVVIVNIDDEWLTVCNCKRTK